jgi:hypothetical protein
VIDCVIPFFKLVKLCPLETLFIPHQGIIDTDQNVCLTENTTPDPSSGETSDANIVADIIANMADIPTIVGMPDATNCSATIPGLLEYLHPRFKPSKPSAP